MKFLLDLQVLQSDSRSRGSGRYSRGLAQGLVCGPHAADASVLLNLAVTHDQSERQAPVLWPDINASGQSKCWDEFDEIKQWLSNCGAADRIHVFRGLTGIAGTLSGSRARADACEAMYDAYVNSVGVDLVYVPSPFEGFGNDVVVGSTAISRLGPARVMTVHDLIPFEAPEIYLTDPVREAWYRRRLAGLLKADLLLTNSEHTRNVAVALLELTPERVVSIGTDADPIFRKMGLSPQMQTSLLARYGICKPFLMHVGTLEPRKNIAILIRAFAHLPAEIRNTHHLVLVGVATNEQISEMRAIARASGGDPENAHIPGVCSRRRFSGFVRYRPRRRNAFTGRRLRFADTRSYAVRSAGIGSRRHEFYRK